MKRLLCELLILSISVASRAFSRSIAVQAEEAAPWDSWGSDDYGPEIAKLQSEAEERLEKKISELMANIETTGTK